MWSGRQASFTVPVSDFTTFATFILLSKLLLWRLGGLLCRYMGLEVFHFGDQMGYGARRGITHSFLSQVTFL